VRRRETTPTQQGGHTRDAEARPRKREVGHLDRHKLIEYGRKRADQGAGPVTLGIDIGVIQVIVTHAAAVHGLEIRVEGVDLARVALKRLGLIGKGIERDRRPTTAELGRLFRCFDENARLTMPMTRIVQFAIATAMRLDEICRADWSDLDTDRRMLLIRDRKDPLNKAGNDQLIPLFAATGFDAWALVMAQAKNLGKAKGPIFPTTPDLSAPRSGAHAPMLTSRTSTSMTSATKAPVDRSKSVCPSNRLRW
jgi:integrase